MNVIARLEFELAYSETAVQHFSHYTMKTLLHPAFGEGVEEIHTLKTTIHQVTASPVRQAEASMPDKAKLRKYQLGISSLNNSFMFSV